MNRTQFLLLAGALLATHVYAVETRFWQQTDQSDFEKGTLRNLSLRSDGRLYLAPEFREIFDPSTPYLWAVAADGKGNIYAGGGGGGGNGSAKLFLVDSAGKGKALAELQGLEIHAIAVGPDGQAYAATDPDGKVYKVAPDGKSQLFYDPHAKYIWALAFNRQGDLFVATGDQGEIHRVTKDGKGSVFFKTEETHARSLAMDAQDNLIVGTEPGGLIIRVSPSGAGFVLFQTPKREVTAVAVAKTGEIFAAAVGVRSTTAPSVPTPAPAPAPPAPAAAIAAARAAAPPSLFTASPAPISGGSEVYRINTDGSPRKVWSNAQDVVYAVGFDFSNHPLFATGNRGRIYRLDSDSLSTLLVDGSPTQITNFASAPGGRLFVATGNIGRIYELGSKPAAKGTFESEVFDAGSFTSWGRLSFRGTPQNVTVVTRSGNLNRPQDNWSPWAPLQNEPAPGAAPCPRCLNGRVQSPPARFVQYKVELAASGQATVPEVASVELAYLPKNVAPTLDDIEITPPNYKFPAPSGPVTPSASLSLPPLGQKKRAPSVALDLSSSTSLTAAKGMIGARWAASDENGDSLTYAIYTRGVGETSWKLLRNKLRDKYYSWDSSAFPDGEYEVKVTVSDAPGNTPAEALTASAVSDPFLIDNTPPHILNLGATPSGGKLEVHWKARDARSIIDHAEYSINGGDWIAVQPKAKLSDAPEEEYLVTVDRTGTGEQTIAVRVSDAYDNQSVDKIVVK